MRTDQERIDATIAVLRGVITDNPVGRAIAAKELKAAASRCRLAFWGWTSVAFAMLVVCLAIVIDDLRPGVDHPAWTALATWLLATHCATRANVAHKVSSSIRKIGEEFGEAAS